MPEVTRKRTGELVRGVFQVLLPNPDGLRAKDVLSQLASLVPPTDFEARTYPKHPDVRRYEKTIRFSTIPAVKAGWLIKDKGQWNISDEGRRAFQQFVEPEQFMRE